MKSHNYKDRLTKIKSELDTPERKQFENLRNEELIAKSKCLTRTNEDIKKRIRTTERGIKRIRDGIENAEKIREIITNSKPLIEYINSL